MESIINSSDDLATLAGAPQHAEFMAMLAGTLWRVERDDEARCWRAVEDDSTITRYGLTRADFPDAMPPPLPDYVDAGSVAEASPDPDPA